MAVALRIDESASMSAFGRLDAAKEADVFFEGHLHERSNVRLTSTARHRPEGGDGIGKAGRAGFAPTARERQTHKSEEPHCGHGGQTRQLTLALRRALLGNHAWQGRGLQRATSAFGRH